MSGEWAKPREYLRIELVFDRLVGICGECHETVGWKGVNRCEWCGTEFKAVTSAFDRQRALCERLRPDLPYVVVEWV